MLLKRRNRTPLVLLCLTAAILFGICKWYVNMGVWGAAWTGDLTALKQKLDMGGSPNSSWQCSALRGAIGHKHRQAAVLLLQRGANPNEAVDIAVMRSDPALVELMFAYGLNVHGTKTRSALGDAIMDARADMVALLLRHRIDPNGRSADDGKTPLQEAHTTWALKQHDSARILALLRTAGAK